MNIFITGGGRGIGFAAAKKLAALGHRVFVGVRNVTLAEIAFKGLDGEPITAIKLDLTRRDTIKPAADQLLSAAGNIDALVNNAGISNLGALEDQKDDEFRRIMDTNFYGHYHLTRALLPHMREQQRGRIVMVSSLSGLFGLPGETAYCCSKFAMEAMAECLRYEVAPFGINVSVINPTYTRTALAASTELDRATPADSPYRELMSSLLEAQQQGEEDGDSEETVADAIVSAILDQTPKLRYLPGSANDLYQLWKSSSDEDFREAVEQTLALNQIQLAS